MDARVKFIYWENKAIYDLETARAMQQTGRYSYVVFMSQQAIEKIVKGLYVLYLEHEPARTHNIWLVFKELLQIEMIRLSAEDLSTRAEGYKSFFSDLLFYYIAERYPDYKQQISSTVTEIKAKEVLTKAEEVFVWLQSLSQYKN